MQRSRHRRFDNFTLTLKYRIPSDLKNHQLLGLNNSASISGSVIGPTTNSAAISSTTSSVTKDKKKEKKEKKETKTKLKLKKSTAPESDSDNGKGRSENHAI